MKTVKIIFILLSFVAGLASLTSCSDDGPNIAEAPVFAMDENYEITATCANAYKAYVNGIETILPYTITQTYKQQTIVVSGYGYGVNLQVHFSTNSRCCSPVGIRHNGLQLT